MQPWTQGRFWLVPNLLRKGEYRVAGDNGNTRGEDESERKGSGKSPGMEATCFMELLGSVGVAHVYLGVGPGQQNCMDIGSHVGETRAP